MNTSSEERYRIWLKKKEMGDDEVYLVGGGEKPHVGAVSICEPGKEPISIQFKGHRDKEVTEMICKEAADKKGKRTACVGGIHIDNATEEEINKIMDNCRKLKEKI